MTTAALYARYSTDLQDDSSIGDQFRVCEDYAARHDIAVVARYADEGISGAAIGNRPGFQRMMAAAQRGEFDALLVMELSRLSRSTADLTKTIDRLNFRGIRVIGVSNGYDSDRKGHKLQAGVEGVMGEAFRHMIADKVHTALHGRAARGLFAGGLPYGYRSEDTDGGRRLVIDPDQAAIVRGIFQAYADGAACRAIAVDLNARRVPSPRGSTWVVSAIYGSPSKGTGIINNELYAGRYVWNRSQWIKDPDSGTRTRVERPRAEWQVRDCPELRIIDDELWRVVRARMDTPRNKGGSKGKGERPRTLFGGLLRCGHCGGAVVAINASSYGCANRHDRGASVCAGLYTNRKTTDARLLSALRDELQSPATLAAVQAEFQRLVREHERTADSVHKTARARRTELDKEIAHLVEAIASVGISQALRDRLTAAETERAQLDKLTTARSHKAPHNVLPDYRALLLNLAEELQADTPKARAAIAEKIGEITLKEEGQEVWAEFDPPAERMLLKNGEYMGMVAGVRFGSHIHASARRVRVK